MHKSEIPLNKEKVREGKLQTKLSSKQRVTKNLKNLHFKLSNICSSNLKQIFELVIVTS